MACSTLVVHLQELVDAFSVGTQKLLGAEGLEEQRALLPPLQVRFARSDQRALHDIETCGCPACSSMPGTGLRSCMPHLPSRLFRGDSQSCKYRSRFYAEVACSPEPHRQAVFAELHPLSLEHFKEEEAEAIPLMRRHFSPREIERNVVAKILRACAAGPGFGGCEGYPRSAHWHGG
jgi:hypothetical protein